MKMKKVYTVIAVLMLILLYVIIFCFSAEDGESSSEVSVKVTKALLKVYYRIVGGGGGNAAAAAAVSPIEGIIRKLAHFTEYMCVGLLSYSLVVMWYQPVLRGCLFVLLQLLVSAGLDEFHQYFIPGRYASVRDVLIDVAGGAAGILVILIGRGIGKGWKSIRRRK